MFKEVRETLLCEIQSIPRKVLTPNVRLQKTNICCVCMLKKALAIERLFELQLKEVAKYPLEHCMSITL